MIWQGVNSYKSICRCCQITVLRKIVNRTEHLQNDLDKIHRWSKLTKELEVIWKVNYQCPLEKCDHVLIELEVNDSIKEGRREEHKNGRYIYGKADFVGLKNFCRQAGIFFMQQGALRRNRMNSSEYTQRE